MMNLDSRTEKANSTDTTVELTEIAQKNSIFNFSLKTFRQEGGIVIGTKLDQTQSILSMTFLKKEMLKLADRKKVE